MLNIYIVYEINLWLYTLGKNFASGNSLFEIFEMTANDDLDKCKCSGYGTGFNVHGGFGYLVVMGLVKTSEYSVQIWGNLCRLIMKKNQFLVKVQCKCKTILRWLQKKNSIYFTERHQKFCFSLHYTGVNIHIFVNAVKICKFKAKDSQKTQFHYF